MNVERLKPLLLGRNTDQLMQVNENDETLRVGYGISRVVATRVLCYDIAANEIAAQSPNIRLEKYVATEFAELMGVDNENALQTAATINTLTTQFQREFYPDVSTRTTILHPRALNPSICAAINRSVPAVRSDEECAAFAAKLNGRPSLEYLAAHALYMADNGFSDEEQIVPGNGNPPLMIGSRAEKIPYKARQKIQQTLNPNGPPPRQIFTTVGNRPPYVPVDGEPLVGQPITSDYLLDCSPEEFTDFGVLLASTLPDRTNPTTFDISTKKKNRPTFLRRADVQRALTTVNEFVADTIL